MNNRSIVSKEIQDEHLDMLIRLAFKMEEEEEIQSLLSEQTRELSAEDMTHKSLAYALFLEKLEAQQKKEKRKRRIQLWKGRVPKLIEIAACLILILGVSTSIAVAHVECIRVMVMELLIEMQDDHASLRLIESEKASAEVPPEWKGEYFPTYIPEGYEVYRIHDTVAKIDYINSAGKWICFNEYTSAGELCADIEEADVTYIDIQGSEAMIVEKPDATTISWQLGNRYFYLSCETGKDMAVQIARSVCQISR